MKKRQVVALQEPHREEAHVEEQEIKQSEPKPEVEGVISFFGPVYCGVCQRALTAAFSSKGKLQLQHDRSDCIHAGKHFEPPTVMLREAK